MELVIPKITTINLRDVVNYLRCRTVLKRCLDGDNRDMDERREIDEVIDSREI